MNDFRTPPAGAPSEAASPSALALLLGAATQNQFPLPSVLAGEQAYISNRLGVASGLFTALRAKHLPTAQHALRVAVRCSSFARALDLTPADSNVLEISALLHDIGNIGIPDQLLQKPARLTESETKVFEQHRQIGLEIVSKCCSSEAILNTIRYCDCWYDGTRPEGLDCAGDDIPFHARVLSIVNAYDSMTTDRVYRRALSADRALNELYASAGTQFDPRLVRVFCELSLEVDPEIAQLLHVGLSAIHDQPANDLWQLRQPLFGHSTPPTTEHLFQRRLVDNMCDGLVFVNITGQVTFWNRSIERLTGIPASSIYEKSWTPTLLELRDTEGNLIREAQCPVLQAVYHGAQSLRRLTVRRPNHKNTTVDLHVIPVLDNSGNSFGAAAIFHDVSSELHLQERVQHLHQKATHDPLTSVANRAEFDRKLTEFVDTHLKMRVPCSLIICDIDRFKQINDVHGHQAGDEALISFAKLLKSHCRAGDVVARYGGEEFVMLCPDCDLAAAARRAEEVRVHLAQTPQSMLGGRNITASFGVTELQAGDSPETMLRRADRALLEAKDTGRNRVVQTGAGLHASDDAKPEGSGWLTWWKQRSPEAMLNRQLLACVPQNIATEKLRGFIADHSAKLIDVRDNHAIMELESSARETDRRVSDRRHVLIVELQFQENRTQEGATRTIITVTIRPKRTRDRRADIMGAAQKVFLSLRSYLVATEYLS